MPLTSDISLWFIFSLTVFITYLYVDHFVHTMRTWRRHADLRSFRHMLIAFVAALGLIVIVLGRMNRLGWIPEGLTLASIYVLTGAMLVVGCYLWLSWRRKE